MTIIKPWMYPSYYFDDDYNVCITFLTSDGVRHRIRCRWNQMEQVYTFRFRGNTWRTTLSAPF